MTLAPTKAMLLEQIERERIAWERLLADVGEQRMLQPGATGDWSFKDVVAHLNGWRAKTIENLEAAVAGRAPAPPPWPEDFDEDVEDQVDQINDWIYTTNRDRPLDQVLAEYRASFERMRAAVVALPERNLIEEGYYSWLGDRSLAMVIDSSFGHLHEEHEPVLRSWLGQVE